MSKIKVILTQDVAGQGRKGEIINVSEGYAKNFLLKNNKGIIATDEELKKLENKRLKAEKKLAEEKAKAQELKKFIEEKVLVMEVKAGESGKIFGSVTTKEISAAIEKDFGLNIDKKKIDANIKTTGEHIVTLKLHSDVKAELKLVAKG
ncbi:50S ribosomal protein L9 [uncultured Ilyobacter sp.]|jgi:large subunit ribosomal protein L9|uniref:50S ribosomal protein L9 n=1 Tax=uncultured Ilyobacter sp. TaxID=544433 RepID=UPI0029BFB074|nr:50S ribosomal protein L9 [uncultured Ilyobacter sp.]